MDRRTVLGYIGLTGVAVGGVGLTNVFEEATDFPGVTVEADEFHGDVEVDVSVSVIEQFSPESPAKLRIELANREAVPIQCNCGASPPFSGYISQESEPMYVIPDANGHVGIDQTTSEAEERPDRSIVPEEPKNGCWPLPGNLIVYGGSKRVEIAPGESIRETYTLVSSPDSLDCFVRDEYRFQSARYLGSNAPWGFAVHLE